MSRDGVAVSRQPSGVWRIETTYAGERVGLVFCVDEHVAYRIAAHQTRVIATWTRELAQIRQGAGAGGPSSDPAA